MSKINKSPKTVAEKHPHDMLTRATTACLLWENQFYIDGISHANYIADLVPRCDPEFVFDLADKLANKDHLRHVPLLLAVEMAKHDEHKKLVAKLLSIVINRPDSLAETLAIYWRNGRCPVSAQIKKGLAKAFRKFNEGLLAKYDRKGAITLRDVAFICHPSPGISATGLKPEVKHRAYKNSKRNPHKVLRHQESPLCKLVNRTLPTPNTWEVRLSAGEDKKEVFTDLLKTQNIGALALLRNLRNMLQSNVDYRLIQHEILTADMGKIFPHQLYSAYLYADKLSRIVAQAVNDRFLEIAKKHKKLAGRTAILVDVSGSMDSRLADRSERKRIDVSCALSVLLKNVCEDAVIYSFSDNLVAVDRLSEGASLENISDIASSQPNGCTYLKRSLDELKSRRTGAERTIVITDEESHDGISDPIGKGYVINVASSRNGLDLVGKWTRINGWSDHVVRYIIDVEAP